MPNPESAARKSRVHNNTGIIFGKISVSIFVVGAQAAVMQTDRRAAPTGLKAADRLSSEQKLALGPNAELETAKDGQAARWKK